MSRLCQQECGRLAFEDRDGYLHKSCCKECFSSRGAQHGGRCAQRQASMLCATLPARTLHQTFGTGTESAVESSQSANRNWHAHRTPVPSSSLIVHLPLAKSYYILSLGLERGLGGELLHRNPEYGPYVFDVRDVLSRLSDYIGGPNGTNAVTKARIGQLDGFSEALNIATVTVLTHQFIILACTSGHHRSVAIAEILYERLTRPSVREMQVHCFHYELASESARVECENVFNGFFASRTSH